jgi:2-oxoglutarate dehydrogenase E1 component
MNLYARYRKDPQSVPADWMVYFETLDGGTVRPANSDGGSAARELLAAFRSYGHKEARLDPLGLTPVRTAFEIAERTATASIGQLKFSLGGKVVEATAAESAEILRSVYCGHAALEASHLEHPEERAWIYETYERELLAGSDQRVLISALESILLADEFERFIKMKWPAKKRFGIEGSESSAVILRQILQQAAESGQKEVVIGGMHRGRLATLATVLGKSLPVLLSDIKGKDITEGDARFTGDAAYHNGLATKVETDAGAVDVRLLPHPSHLIVVAPVAVGAARARQEMRASQGASGGVLPVLMHTDAAFAGQGLVSELLQMDGIEGYSPGGVIHLVVNNQIGFTTLPEEGRSTRYPTDIGKAYGVPVLHVNGDDPIAAAAVARVAHAWQRRMGKDVIIDLICYRRNGHNELDEPRFTQPVVYTAIEKHRPLPSLFTEHVRQRSPKAYDVAEEKRRVFARRLADAYENYDKIRPNQAAAEINVFPEARGKFSSEENPVTGVEASALLALGREITELPAGFSPDPKVRAFLRTRRESLEKGSGINMATAEALAFATLLCEGTSVRLSGQDCVRGAFTQRHLKIYDLLDGSTFVPLASLARGATRFDAINSPLTEYGVLAFEFGMSLADPDRLVIWEAQFGDFLNGAQVAVDQYITTAESKWRMQSSLVIALPHGLEGQGPDHSSARIERILQSCASGNITVALPSTPANLFHLLRRQQRGGRRAPLFLMAPKSLLREKACQSRLSDFEAGTRFLPLLSTPSQSQCERIIFCSGKIFYLLSERRSRDRLETVSLVRLEQLYPFPEDEVRTLLAAHPSAELVWCQEEPRNQGTFSYVVERFAESGVGRLVRYVGRPPMAAAAGGSIERHEREQEKIVSTALHGAD